MDEFAIYKPCDQWMDWHEIEPTFRFDYGKMIEENQFIHHYLDAKHALFHENRAVSAYALFFRERQPTAKRLYPHANFGEFSKIIAAEWQSMSSQEKTIYKKKSERLRRNQIRVAAMAKIRSVVNHQIAI